MFVAIANKFILKDKVIWHLFLQTFAHLCYIGLQCCIKLYFYYNTLKLKQTHFKVHKIISKF